MYAPDVPEVRRGGARWLENILVILDKRGCDKHCPYCTADATNWPLGEDKLHLLPPLLQGMRERRVHFEYMTVSGNGEPGMYRPETLASLRLTIEEYRDLFDHMRFQSGGFLFWDPQRFEIFHDFIMEVTRVAVDSAEDMHVLGYRRDYTQADTFRRSRVGLNHVLLHANFATLLDDLERYRDKLDGQLETLNLKILNVNTRSDERTRTGKVSRRTSRWIQEHALLGEDADRIIERVSSRFPITQEYDPVLDRVVWNLHGVPLILVTKRERYGRLHVVFNKGQLIDYLLRQIPLDDLR